jgi:hypothetical protein
VCLPSMQPEPWWRAFWRRRSEPAPENRFVGHPWHPRNRRYADHPDGSSYGLASRHVWHCFNGIAFAAVYAKILIVLRKQSNVSTGVLLGLALWVILMLTLPILFSRDRSVR